MKEFIKDRQRVTTVSAKVKSSKSSSGTRRGGEHEMMWKGHWLDEAKTARHGYLTKEEAESKWNKWLADRGVAATRRAAGTSAQLSQHGTQSLPSRSWPVRRSGPAGPDDPSEGPRQR